jgi:hypothetical protein
MRIDLDAGAGREHDRIAHPANQLGGLADQDLVCPNVVGNPSDFDAAIVA